MERHEGAEYQGCDLTCNGMGLCHSLGYLFHDKLRIFAHDFQEFLHLPDLWVWFYVKIHLCRAFWHFGFMGILFRNFSGFMGGSFTI